MLLLPTLFAALVATDARAADLYWDANGATAGTGGTGSWVSTSWRDGSDSGTLGAWADGNNALLGGTSGTVTLNSGNVSAAVVSVGTSGYAITSSSGGRALTAAQISLSDGVSLSLEINSGTGAAAWNAGAISSGIGSALTLRGGAASGTYDRLAITTETTISVPTTISPSGAGTGAAIGFYSNVAGSAKTVNISSNITNNSAAATLLGATNSNTLIYSGKLSGTGAVTFSADNAGAGGGTILLNSATSDYSGATIINSSSSGTVKLGVDNALPSGTALVFGRGGTNSTGSVDLNGKSLTVGSLATNLTGAGVAAGIVNSSGTASTLSVNGSASTTYASTIANSIALSKAGAGTLTLTGANTFTGSTAVTGGSLAAAGTAGNQALGGTSSVSVTSGTLLLGASNQINNSASLTFGTGGVFSLGGSSEGSGSAVGLGSLILNASTGAGTATIDFGGGNSTLVFNGVNSRVGKLLITNFDPANDHIAFNNFAQFSTLFGQGDISINGIDGYGSIAFGSYTELLVAVPEPTTWLGAVALLGLVGYRERRRLLPWAAFAGRGPVVIR